MLRPDAILVILFAATLGCAKKGSLITIVDVGHNNRVEIGKQLRVINKYSPKLIALDFFLVPDSLEHDTILVKELNNAKMIIQGVGLHWSNSRWYGNGRDSLDISNPKFNAAEFGFLNLMGEDSVLVKELPMMQPFGTIPIYSFSYVIARNSYGVDRQFIAKNYEPVKLELKGLGRNYQFISRKDLAAGKFRSRDFKDKIVIMGYLGGKEDFLYLNKEKKQKVNGVEVHAAIIEEIIVFDNKETGVSKK
jgi:CHASE2 domain-containing sensor protein